MAAEAKDKDAIKSQASKPEISAASSAQQLNPAALATALVGPDVAKPQQQQQPVPQSIIAQPPQQPTIQAKKYDEKWLLTMNIFVWFCGGFQFLAACITIINPIYRKKKYYLFDYVWIILNIATYAMLLGLIGSFLIWKVDDFNPWLYLCIAIILIFGFIELGISLTYSERKTMKPAIAGFLRICGVAKSVGTIVIMFLIKKYIPKNEEA